MADSRHFGLIGGLGVGAAVIYYRAIAAACAARGVVPRLTLAHAHAPNALAFVESGRIEALADYLAGFARALEAAGAAFFAIPAITPHVCRAELARRAALPMVDILDATRARLALRGLKRVALFGTRFTIDSALFGALAGIAIVRPRDGEVDEIHRLYLQLAQAGRIEPGGEARLREIADTLRRRDAVEAILLAGTDLNLVFDEATAGFPAVDCAAAHVDAIVARMVV